MKRLLALLLVLTVLTGCGPRPSPETTAPPTQSVTVQTTAPTEIPTAPPTTEPEPRLLDRAKPWKEGEALLEIPLDQLSGPYCDSVQLMGDRLLLGAVLYEDEDDEEVFEGGQPSKGLWFRSVDLRTGETVGERTLMTSNYVHLQQLGSSLAVCDNQLGLVEIYDRDLNLLRSYRSEPDEFVWYAGQRNGRDVLYRFGYQQDATVEDLQTHERETVFSWHRELWPGEQRGSTLVLPALIPGTDMVRNLALDLSTGAQTDCPIDGPLTGPVKVGECWLGSLRDQGDTYLLYRDGGTWQIALEGENLILLDDGRLYQTDGTTMRLYDPEGHLLDSCTPGRTDQNDWFWELLYSELYGGYFMMLDDEAGQRHLLLWQPKTEPQEDGALLMLPREPRGEMVPGTLATPEQYERAARMSEKYGITIRIADQCDSDFGLFQADLMENVEWMDETLDTLERCLDRYPAHFLEQLRWGQIRYPEIQLTGELHADADTYDGDTSYAAFVYTAGDTVSIVCNGYVLYDTVIAHEMSHVIDRKLEWDAARRPDALYSEEGWAQWNPEGFRYAYDYQEVAESFDDSAMYAYFMSPYSTTYPTEDRATVMESAMCCPWNFDGAPGMQEKLRYYSACIRDCFDTTGWPEVTEWEQVMEDWSEDAA